MPFSPAWHYRLRSWFGLQGVDLVIKRGLVSVDVFDNPSPSSSSSSSSGHGGPDSGPKGYRINPSSSPTHHNHSSIIHSFNLIALDGATPLSCQPPHTHTNQKQHTRMSSRGEISLTLKACIFRSAPLMGPLAGLKAKRVKGVVVRRWWRP